MGSQDEVTRCDYPRSKILRATGLNSLDDDKKQDGGGLATTLQADSDRCI